MKDRIVSGKNGLGNGFDMAVKILAIIITVSAILPIASSYEARIDFSKNVSLNITYSLFNESNETNVTYYVQVKNDGETLIKDIIVTDILPPGVFYLGPNEQDEKDAPLLKCIAHNIDKTTNKLTWYIDKIHTKEYKWLNFTVQKLGIYVNSTQNKVFSEGVALGYFIEGTSVQTAVQYAAPKPSTEMGNANIEPHPQLGTEVAPEESASDDVSLETDMPHPVLKPAEGMSNADIEPQTLLEKEIVPEEDAINGGIVNSMSSDATAPSRSSANL